MRRTWRWRRWMWLGVCAAAGSPLVGAPAARAADRVPAPVRVRYVLDPGATTFAPLVDGTEYFTDESRTVGKLGKLPPEAAGMMFTRRPAGRPSEVVVDVPAGATVAVLVSSEKRQSKKDLPGIERLHRQIEALGFTRLDDVQRSLPAERAPAVYERTFDKPAHLTLAGATWSGTVIASKYLANAGDADVATTPAGRPAAAERHGPPTTQLASQQASINALEVIETDGGLSLGRTSEVVLTANRGNSPRPLAVRFVETVGAQMTMATDEALRYLRLTYANWDADRAEITFEDKYEKHDGGSIGTAVGVLVESVIQGFQVDPRLAITGDVSANGKVRAIGGVAAKVAGATAGKCDLVVIPIDNLDQLADDVLYNGPSVVTGIQVLGVTDLADAVATVRSDRDPKLARAIQLFADFQRACRASPAYAMRKEAAGQLREVLGLAPHHLSAQLLLDRNLGRAPMKLSPAASDYYTALAVRPVLPALEEQSARAGLRRMPSGAVRSGLADLRKLRPLADPKIRPQIDAWTRFIAAWNEYEGGGAPAADVERQWELLQDELRKEQADPELMRKLLREGV